MRSIRRTTLAGAVIGAALPFVVGGASVPFFTDTEARIGYGVLAAFVFAMFGAIVGWAIGALISRRWRDDDRRGA